jgi:hypothetical protein
MSYWAPQPGPQARAVICPADFILYGGARGGGKSDCAIGRQIVGAQKFGKDWNGLMIRRYYKDFAKIRQRWDQLISSGLPAVRVGGDSQMNHIRFTNGARVTMAAFESVTKADDYQGHEFTEISFDDAGTIPYIGGLVQRLKGTLRSPVRGAAGAMFITANPGGPGHSWLKSTFIDPASPYVVHRDAAGLTHVFIPAYLSDNPILDDNDPRYRAMLESITDPVLRRAWIEGDWTAFSGQAFDFSEIYHVVDSEPVPEHAALYMTFDWGFGKPFSVGWWWTDADGRLWRFAEWYGWNGVENEGARLSDTEVAHGIKQREFDMGLSGRAITRLAGPDCFAKRPDYKGGGQGPSTAETWATLGVHISPGDPARAIKIRQFRERLRVKKDSNGKMIERPMLVACKTCKHFIRTIPTLALDTNNMEDIDTDQEDHVYDEACHVVMARPMRSVEGELAPVQGSMIERAFGRAGL